MPSFVADLHIHSHYSRATSQDLNFEQLSRWAQLKGVQVVGTGDIAHPGWLQEMRHKLEEAETGLFRLKDEVAVAVQRTTPAACQQPVRFLLCGEVSNIYKKNGQVRKVHHLIFVPSLTTVERLQARLEKIGNIRSDGRPILGLDSRDLLEIVLETDPLAYLIPAHIWTPWFAVLGSMSGFDSLDECFDDLTPHIFAVETGLSSDPPMNWRVSSLDRYTLISNSDAHSPQKLAREATVLDCDLSYAAILDTLKNHKGRVSTLEFFPEEGKYHFDGHRKCGIRWHPETTHAHHKRCPICGHEVTVGVMNRVAALADRKEGGRPAIVQNYRNLVSLPEILAEAYGVGAASKQVQQRYDALLGKLGPELTILQQLPLDMIEQSGGELLAEGIRRMRAGELTVEAGYDGEYGVVKLFEQHERRNSSAQLSLLATPEKKTRAPKAIQETPNSFTWNQQDLFAPGPLASADTAAALHSDSSPVLLVAQKTPTIDLLVGLNDEQRAAVQAIAAPLLIVAGPGAGKTRTLTVRIAHLISAHGVAPEAILAITFTNKAAEEMLERLAALLGNELCARLTVKTFHAFGAQILHECASETGLASHFSICSPKDQAAILKEIAPTLPTRELHNCLEQISRIKNRSPLADGRLAPADGVVDMPQEFSALYQRYQETLCQNNMVDFDDLILLPVQLFERNSALLQRYRERYRWLSIDEYQDINAAQYQLLRLLTTEQSNICAIGDPDQAIYAFRGADRAYFLRFAQDFPGAHRLHLHRNYRSTQLILDASRQVIERNPDRQRIQLLAQSFEVIKVELHPAPTDQAEAEFVVHQIEKMVGGTSLFSLDSGRVAESESGRSGRRSFGDFAVLYRLNAQSRLLSEAFDRSGIPYQTIGQTPLLEHKEIAEIVAYLAWLHNPSTTLYLATIFDLTVEQVERFKATDSFPIKFSLNGLSPAQRRRAEKIAPFLQRLQQTQAQLSVAQMIEQVQTFLDDELERRFEDKQAERIAQLRLRAVPFAQGLEAFLETLLLQRETDLYDPRADRVTLLTLHAAKGLEFPVVFIVGCEETLLPYQRPAQERLAPNMPDDALSASVAGRVDLEEERRLFYVGMTRAQQKLFLTRAQRRTFFGQRISNAPSPFLADIEDALKEINQGEQRTGAKVVAEQLSLF